MKQSFLIKIILSVVMIFVWHPLEALLADDDHDEARHRKHHHERHHGGDDHQDSRETNSRFKVVDNQTYLDMCAACHFAYQPELLPSASWTELINSIPSHFGEDVDIDSESKTIVAKYLQENSAEKSSAKPAVKILKSLKGKTPSRITEVPYIQKKHHKLSAKVLSRDAIGGSLSNCAACHRSAEKGIYEEDDVSIPKQDKT